MSDKPNLIRSMQIPPIRMQKYERYLPTAFDESMTILEKINKVIHFLYEYSDITEQMLEKWNEVYEWINNEGLEEMVRYRLDELVANGTIAKIINEEIFDELNQKVENVISDLEETKSDLINDLEEIKQNLITEVNELIDNITTEFNRLKQLIEEQIQDKLDFSSYYKEITTDVYRYEETDENIGATYYLTKVPKYDENGEVIKMKQGFSGGEYGSPTPESARDFSLRVGASLVTNVSPYSTTTGNIVGLIIKDGEVLQNRLASEWNYILAFDDENNLKSFPPNTDPNTIISQGYNNAVSTFAPLIENGRIVPDNVLNSRNIFKQRHPRQAIAQDRQGNTYIMSVDGRKLGDGGMTARETAETLLSHGMVFAHMFDGGGSSQTIYFHNMVNKITDRDPLRERELKNFLYFGKDRPNNALQILLEKQGDINKVRQTQPNQLYQLRYTRGNYFSMIPYLANGWKEYSKSGANHPRAWVLPNMTLYMVGTVRDGEFGKACLRLPDKYRPNFSTHHLVPGNRSGEFYKIIIGTSGDVTPYKWSGTADDNYIKLDGLFIPLNPVGMGI